MAYTQSFFTMLVAISLLPALPAMCDPKPSIAQTIADSRGKELIGAAENNNMHRVQELIAAGANLNVQDNGGLTALMHSARGNYEEIVQLLIDAGASPDIMSNTGMTALMFAVWYDNAACILINAHPKLDIQNYNFGHTALMRAAECGNYSITCVLIKVGCSLNLKDKKGNTALMLAASESHRETARILIGAGTLMEPPMPEYESYKIACDRLFNALQKPFNSQHPYGIKNLKTALRTLAMFAKSHVFIDLTNGEGNTPFHYAAASGNKLLVIFVLYLMVRAHRAESATRQNNTGHTPVHLAVGHYPTTILPLLFKAY